MNITNICDTHKGLIWEKMFVNIRFRILHLLIFWYI
jgi:hypothetical protein